MYRRFLLSLVAGTAVALSLCGCTKVAMTGRSQLNLIPASEMMSMSYQQYAEVVKGSKLSGDSAQVRRIRAVGTRIQRAVEGYFAEIGQSDQLRDYRWEFNLIESDEMNAWCMPGGKVAFYTGILPVCRDDTGIAVVMGHEVAHAVAEHGAERMSQALLTQLGGVALSTAISSEPERTQALWMGAFGLGAGRLPSGSRAGLLAADGLPGQRSGPARIHEHAPLGRNAHAEDSGTAAGGTEGIQAGRFVNRRPARPRPQGRALPGIAVSAFRSRT